MTTLRLRLPALSLVLLCASACGSDETSESNSRGGGSSTDTGAGAGENDGGTEADTSEPDAEPQADVAPDTQIADSGMVESDTGVIVPDSGEPDTGGGAAYGDPDPVKTPSDGTCPELGSGGNDLTSDGEARTFDLYLPANPEGAPVLFLWHGLGDSASNFGPAMGASQIAQSEGAIVVVPSMGASANLMGNPIWSFPNMLSSVNEPDLVLFDDILACLDAQYDIDNRRVYSAGFSAGALWTSYLTINRAGYLAATAVFSGGVSSQFTFGYQSSDYPLPVLLSHGGTTDVFGGILHFDQMVTEFSNALAADGHFTVLCTHNEGHTITNEIVNSGYDFLFRHSWGSGTSPLADEGLPSTYADTCHVVE